MKPTLWATAPPIASGDGSRHATRCAGYGGRAVSDPKLLRIYLQDHHAAATVGVELVRRARGSNEGTAYGDFLARLADEIDADRRALEAIMDDLGVGPDRAKVTVAWAGERLGRLKLNGRLTGYSPLSRLVELEGLALAVTGKLALWRTLGGLADDLAELDGDYLARLAARAEEQQRVLEEQRLRAAREALSARSATPDPSSASEPSGRTS